MPLYKTYSFKSNYLVGIWKISEPLEFFTKSIIISESEKQYFEKTSLLSRKLQWLACRLLVKELLRGPFNIIYNENGKPFLEDNQYNISFTHTKEFAGVIISKNMEVGIDIEKIALRMEKVSSKFLSEKESIENKESASIEKLSVYWCAKEALFKIKGKHSISLQENLIICPFELEQQGKIEGIIYDEQKINKYILYYEKIEEHMLVFTHKHI